MYNSRSEAEKKEFKECKSRMNDELASKSNIIEQQKYELDCKERDLRALLDANIKFAN